MPVNYGRRSSVAAGLQPAQLEPGIKPGEYAPHIALEDRMALVVANRQRIDIALGVIEILAGLRVDAAHRADHLAAEQDVPGVDHLGEQVDARLVVDAGVEED